MRRRHVCWWECLVEALCSLPFVSLTHTGIISIEKCTYTEEEKLAFGSCVVIAADDDYGGMLMLQSQDQESNKM